MIDVDISDDALDNAIDFDKLDTDPAEQEKIRRIQLAQTIRANTFTAEEFDRYQPLFNKELAASLDREEIQLLSQEYMGRIDAYSPVYIVRAKDSTHSSVLLRPENIINTLPAIYNRVGVVNNLGQDGINIMQAFNNLASAEVDDRFNQKKNLYSKHLALVFNQMSDEQKRAAAKETARSMAVTAVKKAGQTVSSNGIASGVDVQDIPQDMLEELSNTETVTNEKALTSVVEEEEFL